MGLFKRVLRLFKSTADMNENERHIVNNGHLQRENCFVAVINCKRFHPEKIEYLKAAIRRLTNPRTDLTLINKGEIVMREQLIIVNKEQIPLFVDYEEELKEMNVGSKTNKKFMLTNKGRIEVYFIVNNYNDFMGTGVLSQLTEEGIGSIPITVARNIGRITKTVELVQGLSEDEARAFEQSCISSDPSTRIPTESQQEMMRHFDVTLEDARCFDLTLSSIPEVPTAVDQ